MRYFPFVMATWIARMDDEPQWWELLYTLLLEPFKKHHIYNYSVHLKRGIQSGWAFTMVALSTSCASAVKQPFN